MYKIIHKIIFILCIIINDRREKNLHNTAQYDYSEYLLESLFDHDIINRYCMSIKHCQFPEMMIPTRINESDCNLFLEHIFEKLRGHPVV